MDTSKIVKIVLFTTIAILFLITSIISIISASKLVSQTFQIYVLKVEQCTYESIQINNETSIKSEEKCKIDYNLAKAQLAESLAMLIISLPISLFTYKKLFKLYKE